MRNVLLFFIVLSLCSSAFGATKKKKRRSSSKAAPAASATTKTTKSAKSRSSVRKSVATSRTGNATGTAKVRKVSTTRPYRLATRKVYSPWDTPTFADSTYGDVVDGEDLVVRRAAVQALGPYNGTVVVTDPTTGRILTMVNQKLALTGAYQPCSTIKLVASIAGIQEGLIDKETPVRLGKKSSMKLTYALAKSNNPYFARVGEMLGFEKVNHYAHLLGLGEKAGYNIEGESTGVFPDEKPKGIPVGLMTSFGEAIGLTPLQLTALVSSIANGGTLYYLQYPKSQDELLTFSPRVKRKLDLSTAIPEMRPGMNGATEFGTARRANYDPNEPIWGKTGTCTDARTHLGWFGSFQEVNNRRLVVVVLLTGGAHVNGPVASGVAGQVYKNLSAQQYFAQGTTAANSSVPSTSEAAALAPVLNTEATPQE